MADLLDKWDVFHCRLFRESCVFHRGNYVKDLSRLGRELHKIIIVDNSPASYVFHPDNAVSSKCKQMSISGSVFFNALTDFRYLAPHGLTTWTTVSCWTWFLCLRDCLKWTRSTPCLKTRNKSNNNLVRRASSRAITHSKGHNPAARRPRPQQQQWHDSRWDDGLY